MNMKTRTRYRFIDGMLSAAAGAILLFMLVMTPLDLYSFWTDPSDYIGVYQLDTSRASWRWSYAKRPVVLFGLALAGLLMMIAAHLKHENKTWQLIRIAVITLTGGGLVTGFYNWFLTGFDH